ncbi:hypothetical protein GORHZ_247_00660 [Gordonia rhizosphera NBRC 16068]|uniref:Serine hydrolase n=2 Tax=Gordonia rhizosphera TaxID=83341 RepID=K6VCJ6_9ACTN|nr:hypothetical protein GORHZ_247_00660 [Gordonia rhizosphera NBRC 16068]
MVSMTVVCGVVFGGGSAAASPSWWPPQLPPLPPEVSRFFEPPVTMDKKLTKSFAVLQKSMRKSLPGKVGLAIVPIGSDRAVTMGNLKSGRAWSTLKVPVSLAAQRKNGYRVAAMEDKAIIFSDNDAAGELWGSLGGGQASVAAVTNVLREGHDSRTRVSSEVDDPPSYPGYTPWALSDQARFGAHLPCMPGTEDLIRLMSHVAANQQWGIAKMSRSRGVVTAVKGGWGPATSTSPGYLVRQLGIITTNRGQVAVAMAAMPRSGSFGDGTRMLNKVGGWLERNLAGLPAGRC